MTDTSRQKTVLVLGGRSDIGRAIAHGFAADGYAVALAARNAANLETDKSDISLRHNVSVSLHEFDVLDTAKMEAFIDSLGVLPDVVVSVVGLMGEQAENEKDTDLSARVMRSNYEGPALLLGLFANRFEERGSGTLVGVSSVAGDRGRATNYIYGSAKAGFTAFLSGLRNRLARKGVHVVTVKPGFVRTQMTEGMKLPGPITADPEEVAQATVKAVRKGKNTVYTKPVWALIMLIITHIPEAIFKKMSI
ncbi:SDR family oxidoreductase [Hyphomonas sp.]|uniref:SDR family oxidoreductase n=1 Tax=Hyphomonas sp. TaxID=87 RepID=UPI003242C4C1